MTSSFMAGADAPAAAAPSAAPAAAVAGCSGCSDSCDPCAKKAGILDKIKARLGSHKCKSACDSCAPPPAPKCEAPKPTCDPCHAARPNLLDKLKAKFHHKDCGCAPACDGCAAAPAPVPSPAPTPKPMDPKKTSSDGAPAIVIPSPGALVVPSIPVTPVKANSPY
jgi:hypothetical protein